ncbi:uncharacterized protein LOC109608273 isoform X2 [Aethina tumida]|uniref:uncharacterized protein LOC109608273 isoform X2 n=1 Tax=Aethina tumida TaxID=116153 RepID=UPI002148E2B8|nr:uncharacterized protein LOC109608273 isoform X2 [Aethina tumida]
MSERQRSPGTMYQQEEGKLGPTKTAIVLVVVVGCFAVLWPKVFYPMLTGSANNYIKPSPIDRQSGCCDVISELDVRTIKIMSEICETIIKQNDDEPLTEKEVLLKCRGAVLETCGIDISAVLQQQVRLGQSVKQIIDEVRSLNGSLCLKYNFGVAPWKLGVPHRIVTGQVNTIHQERPPHLRSEMVHPAFRERGRAIPQGGLSPLPSISTPRQVPGRPGPIPGLRPTMGGAGHIVPPKQQSIGGPMGLIMPIYTIAIVAFFSYTVIKLFTKKKPAVGDLYPHVEPDPVFRREVFESQQRPHTTIREGVSSKLGDLELDHLRRRLRETEEAMERIYAQLAKVPLKKEDQSTTPAPSGLSNGSVIQEEEEQPTVKVMGLEVTTSREDEKKWARPSSPLVPGSHGGEPLPPPQEIFLEGALPAQSQLLVSDSTTEAESEVGENDAVVLASKMTLSVISLDSSENGTDESSSDKRSEQIVIVGEDDLKGGSSSNGSDDFEKIEADQIEDQIDEIIEEAKHITETSIESDDDRDFLEQERLALELEKAQDDDWQEKVVSEIEIQPSESFIEETAKEEDVPQPSESFVEETAREEKVPEPSESFVEETAREEAAPQPSESFIEETAKEEAAPQPSESFIEETVREIVLEQPKESVLEETKPEEPSDKTVNVEEILEVEEIMEIEQKPVVIDVPVPKPEGEQSEEKDKVTDKTKSSASSGTVEDIEELLSRDDEIDVELNVDYEPSDNGSEEILDEIRNTDRISEERENIDELLEKYGESGSEVEEEEEDEVVEEQEIVEYVDEEVEEEEPATEVQGKENAHPTH